MSSNTVQLTKDVYGLLSRLPRCDYRTARDQLPYNGIYVFHERGEVAQLHGTATDRIVRIGTHREEGRFQARIRNHYGPVNTIGGNKNSSVFRRHLGGALLRQQDPHDPRLRGWTKQGGRSFPEVEEQVSHVLRQNFTFFCFPVDHRSDRLTLERGIIALLAQAPLGQPCGKWKNWGEWPVEYPTHQRAASHYR